MDAYDKDGQDQRDGDRHRDEPPFGHRGAYGGANFFATQFFAIDFHIAQQVNGCSFKPGLVSAGRGAQVLFHFSAAWPLT